MFQHTEVVKLMNSAAGRNKKASIGISALIGIVLVVGSIFVFWEPFERIKDAIMNKISLKPKPNIYNLASEANFKRLSKDIEYFLDSNENEMFIPYSLGKNYMLIGFNKDKSVNSCIKGENFLEPPNICNRRSCLCLCYNGKEKYCDPHKCTPYKGIDYFIGGNPDVLNPYEGKKMDIDDPVSEKKAHCLQINGGKGVDEKNWKTQRIFIQKSTANSKLFLYLGQVDDAKSRYIQK